MIRVVCMTFVLARVTLSADAQQQCLHGPNETPQQQARRREALTATRTVNNLQANQPGAATGAARLG